MNINNDVQRLLDEFVVSQATELARNGAYTQAESLLRSVTEQAQVSVSALDLQARILAQQGRIAEAETLWTRALKLEPDNTACQAALTRIRKLQQHPVWLAVLWPLALACVVVIMCIGLLQFQFHKQRAEFSRQEEVIKHAVAIKPDFTAQLAMHNQIQLKEGNQMALVHQKVVEMTSKMKKLERLLITSQKTIKRMESKLSKNTHHDEKLDEAKLR